MLHVDGLTIAAGPRVLVSNLSPTLAKGQITCLIGPSGCGKSSVLKWLAGIVPKGLLAKGLASLDGGQIAFPHPAIAYQPQSDALFPWLTILDNAVLGLEVAGASRRTAHNQAAKLFAPFGLVGCESLYPHELSGGMRQRAAFLRTIVQDSRFVLLDEPFSALDAVTRLRMQDWLHARLDETPRGVLMVTHDLHEATQMADRILVMSGASGAIVADIAIDTHHAARTEAALAGIRTDIKSLLLEEAP